MQRTVSFTTYASLVPFVLCLNNLTQNDSSCRNRSINLTQECCSISSSHGVSLLPGEIALCTFQLPLGARVCAIYSCGRAVQASLTFPAQCSKTHSSLVDFKSLAKLELLGERSSGFLGFISILHERVVHRRNQGQELFLKSVFFTTRFLLASEWQSFLSYVGTLVAKKSSFKEYTYSDNAYCRIFKQLFFCVCIGEATES